MPIMIHYTYTHSLTEGTTGYFSCEPSPEQKLSQAVLLLAARPMDDFLRRHIITRASALSALALAEVLREAYPNYIFPGPVHSLLRELTLLNPALADACPQQPQSPASQEDEESSLIFLRWSSLPDNELHRHWGEIFSSNQRGHRALKSPAELGLAPPCPETADPALPGNSPVFRAAFSLSLSMLHSFKISSGQHYAAGEQRPAAAETAALAEERLCALGIIAGGEMRHTASLSPVALLRPWNIRLRVDAGRQNHTLEGQATTYGRGLSLPDARASCLMEMVERASAYFSISGNHVENRVRETPLRYARLSELVAADEKALDPNDLPLEVPYNDAPLHWLPGEDAKGALVHVPAQLAGLFCNLDEIALLNAQGSTGIATSCDVEGAKLAALLEIIERDAEAVTPFSKASCFSLEVDTTSDPLIAALLADYRARGINLQFQDLTGPLGVPVYKCFVMNSKGAIAAGHGAGLSARKAVLSALTETPYPYPEGGPSGPMLRKLPVRKLHELPEYSLGSSKADLAMLEELLRKNDRSPLYLDMTHAGLRFPVLRAFIPGLELNADRDAFSRVPYRLYQNYLQLFS